MRVRGLAIAFCAATLCVAAVIAQSSQAAGMCDGHPSTMEGGFPNPLFGTAGPDVIVGTANDDRIDGGGGDDIICSGEGDDEVFGFDGEDRLFGEGGADLLNGEEGDDHILGGGSGDILDEEYDLISGEDGDDHLDGEGGGDIIFGVGGADEILGGEDDDALSGDAPGAGGGTDPDGADTISGGNGIESIEGGPGPDVIDGGPDAQASVLYKRAPSAVTVDIAAGTASGGDGNDTLTGIDGVTGSAFADKLYGSEGSDDLEGGPGKDKLDGRGGVTDLLTYISATGSVTVDLGKKTSSGADGVDKFKGFELLSGSMFDDRLIGSPENDSISGNGGNDNMDGKGGTQDVLNYEAADSAVTVSLAGGNASIGDGQDTFKGFEAIEGSAFDDRLIGDGRDNVLFGGPGEDEIYGRDGSDGLAGDEGSDLVVGGSGILDYVMYPLSPQGVNVDLAAETATSGPDEDTLLEIEGVIGSSFDDQITGDAGENSIAAGPGDDGIDGGGARDMVFFLPGIDPSDLSQIPTGPVVGSLDDGLTMDQGDPTQTVGDSLTSVEILFGTEEDDHLEGSSIDNTMYGGGGNDELDGLGGRDTLDGGQGSDDIDGGADLDGALWIFSPTKVVADLGTGTAVSGPDTDTMTGIEALGGSELNDVLRGDDEDNILFGWAGKDELYGEGGDDGLRGPAVTIEDLGFDFPPETDKVLDGGEGTDACEGANKTSCELDELTPEQAEFVGNLIEAIRDIKRKNGVRVN